jgi:hypothetical protein
MYYKCDLGGIPLENLEIGLGWRDYPFLKRGIVPQPLTALDYRPKLEIVSYVHAPKFIPPSFFQSLSTR